MRTLILGLTLFLSAAVSPAFAQVWSGYVDGSLFVTHVSETGPVKPENRTFSTNFLSLGARRYVGEQAELLFKVRGSLEPLTIPSEGYPQLFQYISPQSGGTLIDRQRANDLLQEASVTARWRAAQITLAPVGQPALGAAPAAERASGREFAEAPFSWDLQESAHVGTRLLGAGFGPRAFMVEGTVFHDSVTTGRHSTVEDGEIDSWSARVSAHPTANVTFQVSRGRLQHSAQTVSSASLTHDNGTWATSAIYTKRDLRNAPSSTAILLESTLTAGRNVLMARGEAVDRPEGTFTARRRQTHVTLGYIFDVLVRSNHRAGIGANIDYHSGSRELQSRYGHKPQSVYFFVRLRGTTPRVAL